MHTKKSIATFTVRLLWRNWALAFGCPALVTLASTVIPPLWLPLIALGASYALILQYRHRVYANDGHVHCSRVNWLTAQTMLAAAIVMAAINIIYSPKILPLIVADNPDIPFITAMIVYPLMCGACIYGLSVKRKCRCCQRCQLNHGYYSSNSTVTTFYFDESQYQLRTILGLSAAISLIDIAYYFAFYNNVNLSSSDRFFFIIGPLTIYILSLGFMIRRYFTIYALALHEDAHKPHRSEAQLTLVRILLLSGDDMLLSRMPDGKWDTPVQEIINHTDAPSEMQIKHIITDALGPGDYRYRYIYTNDGYVRGSNIVHYAVILPDDCSIPVQTERCSIDRIQRLLRHNELSPYIANELFRIHTVTMTWKTYDRDGQRLYPIKNYRPTFRLRDFKDWTVDYNDSLWLRIAHNNQDKPLWKVRRWINRKLFRKSHYHQ